MSQRHAEKHRYLKESYACIPVSRRSQFFYMQRDRLHWWVDLRKATVVHRLRREIAMSLLSSQEVKEALGHILDQLSSTQQQQVLDFARFLRQQVLKPSLSRTEAAWQAPSSPPTIPLHLVPATSLVSLTGLVSLGGDAVADTEAIYNGDSRP